MEPFIEEKAFERLLLAARDLSGAREDDPSYKEPPCSPLTGEVWRMRDGMVVIYAHFDASRPEPHYVLFPKNGGCCMWMPSVDGWTKLSGSAHDFHLEGPVEALKQLQYVGSDIETILATLIEGDDKEKIKKLGVYIEKIARAALAKAKGQ